MEARNTIVSAHALGVGNAGLNLTLAKQVSYNKPIAYVAIGGRFISRKAG